MRAGLAVVGVLVLVAGAVFAGQGLGFIKGSYMTGDMTWFWIGSVMIVVGLVLGAAGLMRRPRKT